MANPPPEDSGMTVGWEHISFFEHSKSACADGKKEKTQDTGTAEKLVFHLNRAEEQARIIKNIYGT